MHALRLSYREGASGQVVSRVLLTKFVRDLSARAEFWLIITLAFGYFIVASTRALLTHWSVVRSDQWAVNLTIFELLVLFVIAWLARERGWSFAKLGLVQTWKSTAGGIGLYVIAIVATNAVYYAITSFKGPVPRTWFAGRLSLAAIVVVSIVNPLFEELLVTGYIVRATSKHGIAFAITASALIRFLYHTYQGPVAAVSILPLGLIFAFVYWRWESLWPLIVAHSLIDFLALLRYRG